MTHKNPYKTCRLLVLWSQMRKGHPKPSKNPYVSQSKLMTFRDFAKHQKPLVILWFGAPENGDQKPLLNLSFIGTFGAQMRKIAPKPSKPLGFPLFRDANLRLCGTPKNHW